MSFWELINLLFGDTEISILVSLCINLLFVTVTLVWFIRRMAKEVTRTKDEYSALRIGLLVFLILSVLFIAPVVAYQYASLNDITTTLLRNIANLSGALGRITFLGALAFLFTYRTKKPDELQYKGNKEKSYVKRKR